MRDAAVFFVSLSALAYEILLARCFAVSQWHHLAFMVISVALFGFGASGTVLSLLDARRPGWEERMSRPEALGRLLCLFSLTAVAAFVLVNRLPLDYARLPFQPIQALYLLAAFLALALPFGVAGTVVSVAYAAAAERTGRTYLATLWGSALGAVLPAVALPFFGEGKLVLGVALFPLILVFRAGGRANRAVSLLLAGGIALLPAVWPETAQVTPSPYKGLSQIRRFPDTRVTETAHGMRGRIDRVESPYIRFAPGLSLTFTGRMPPQTAVFIDADSRVVLYDAEKPGALDFARHSLLHAGYVIRPEPDEVLLMASDGGASAASALAGGAKTVTWVCRTPGPARMIRERYGIEVHVDGPRNALARSRERFSLIHFEHWGASLPGADALTQDHTITVEGISAALFQLKNSGLLVISRRLLLPPSDSLRVFGAALAALERFGADRPADHLALLRSWDTYTLLVSARPLSVDEIDGLRGFAGEMNFDLVHLPGLSESDANRFNVHDAPYYFRAVREMIRTRNAGQGDRFFRDYPLDVVPQTDRRPFPGRFLKWSRLDEIHGSMGGRMYSLLLSGEIVVATVFVEAVIVSALLVGLPLIAVARRGGNGRRDLSPARGLYFFGIGAGFMLTEMYFIHVGTFLLGHPLVSFTAVAAGMLMGSGIGGWICRDWGANRIMPVLGGLLGLLITLWIGAEPMVRAALGWPFEARLMAGLVVLIPTGVMMGGPFVLGMRHLLRSPVGRAYAWAQNGCASVLAAIASAQLALSLGLPAVMAGAVAGYGLALGAAIRLGGRNTDGTRTKHGRNTDGTRTESPNLKSKIP